MLYSIACLKHWTRFWWNFFFIFNTYVIFAYHSKILKKTITIVFKKSEKNDYSNSKIYRSIVLLNTLKKFLKIIMADKITILIKSKRFFSDVQMNVRKDRNTNSVLKLLMEQIHFIWNQEKHKIISILCLNVAEIFDHVFHSKLIHNLRKRKIFEWITHWIQNFLSNRRTNVVLKNRTSFVMKINTEISQKSPISSIFYLFFNIDFLNKCNNSKLKQMF